MQKKITNEYDDTKRMLNVMRSLGGNNSSKTLKEQTESSQNSDIAVINDVEVQLNSSDSMDMKIDDEQKTALSNIIDSFRQQVSQITDFSPGFSITENQIRLDGSLTDNDINFVLIAGDESGLYLNAEMLKMEQEVMVVLDKLLKFEQTYKDAMDPLVLKRKNN